MQSETELRRRARAEGLTLIKYRESSLGITTMARTRWPILRLTASSRGEWIVKRSHAS